MQDEKGIAIGHAVSVLRKTYVEVERMKDDFLELLKERDSRLTSIDQYSYGSNSLVLKANHAYLFGADEKEAAHTDHDEQKRFVALVCAFYDEPSYVSRASWEDQPEVWFMVLDVEKWGEKFRAWHAGHLLERKNRKFFRSGRPVAGGDIQEFEKTYEPDADKNAVVSGQFIGFPLVAITGQDVLREKVVDKLFPETL